MRNWVSSNAYRTYRQPAIDAAAWVAALGLSGALYHLHGASFSLWWIPVLAACAAASQLVLNFPLYKGYRDAHSVEGIALALSTAAVVLAVVLGLSVLFKSGVPPELVVLSGLGAVLLMLAPRCLQWARRRGAAKQSSAHERKWPLEPALALAQEIEARVRAHPAVLQCAHAGSVRRYQSEVGDVEIVVATEHPDQIIAAVLALPQIKKTIGIRKAAGTITKWLGRSVEGIRVDIRFIPLGQFGHSLVYFTGAKAHTNQIRWQGFLTGCRFPHKPSRPDNYFLFWLYWFTTRPAHRTARLETEQDVYRHLGMQFVPPPLREGRGEVEAARQGRLPRLVETTDILGDLHLCTRSEADERAMAEAAARRGYKYIAMVHSGGEVKPIERRLRATETLNAEDSIHVLSGVKVSVSDDGKIACPDSLLNEVDFVIASFDDGDLADPSRLTSRMLLAIEHPRVTIMTVPLSAGQASDEGSCNFDLPIVCRAAREHGVALEIDARPNRLGAAESYVRKAKEFGVRFAIGTYAETASDLDNMRFGLAVAQRGWLTAEDVINAWPLPEVRRFARKRSSGG
jgi:DNA polymerase (family 10)